MHTEQRHNQVSRGFLSAFVLFSHCIHSNYTAIGLNRWLFRRPTMFFFSLYLLTALPWKAQKKNTVNLISLALTSRNFNLWIIEITFLLIQKGPMRFLLLGQTQFIMFMHYLIRYLEGWGCENKFNLLKNCIALSLWNSGCSTKRSGQYKEYAPADLEGIWSQLYHQL